MSDEIKLRWINGIDATPEEWDRIDDVFAARGWMSLNRETSKLLLAEAGDELKGVFVLQLLPSLGPMWIAPSARGSGLADDLVDEMGKFLTEAQARGWIVIADNPIVAKMAEERKMKPVTSKVYTTEEGR